MLSSGSKIAGYEVESVVGAGGIGILYRARQLRLDRPVALKLVEPDVASRPVIRERLRREARTVAALDHPNIVPLYEAGEEDALATDEVADTAGEEEEGAEGDHVGVEDPREARLGEPHVGLDAGEGDVHDRRVDDDHEHARAQHVQSDPALAVVHGLGSQRSRAPRRRWS